MVGRAIKSKSGLFNTTDVLIEVDNVWICRKTLLCQALLRTDTDGQRLFDYCLRRFSETEFFVGKSISWTLREYSYTTPKAVIAFRGRHRGELGGLSFREGAKGLRRHSYDI